MTIERLSFKDGTSFDTQNLKEEIIRLVTENRDNLETLPEGEYDLTPGGWRRHLHRHNLVVFRNGKAIYQAIPRERGVGTREVERGRFGEFEPGGRLVKIPEDQGIVIVSGPLKDRRTLGIYEIIFHHPGLSPRK